MQQKNVIKFCIMQNDEVYSNQTLQSKKVNSLNVKFRNVRLSLPPYLPALSKKKKKNELLMIRKNE